MKLQTYLTEHHSTKLLNGAEVKHPPLSCNGESTNVTPEDIRDFHQIPKVIKLPDWKDFWDVASADVTKDNEEFIELQRQYINLMRQPPHIKHFVPWDGEVLEEPNEDDFNFEYEYDAFQKAQQEVLFEGWEVRELGKFIIEIQNQNKNILKFDTRSNLCCLINPRLKQIKTTDDLNQYIQLYMKIK